MQFLTPKEMAQKWHISVQMVRRYCKEGRIPSVILKDGQWLIPEDAARPGMTTQKEPEKSSLVKQILYQHSKNNHFGIYEYLQVNLAYSSCRMASNRLTRTQVLEIYRTNKVSGAFEAMKVDDMIEVVNHIMAMREMIETIMEPLSAKYIRRLYYLMAYGTYADRRQQICPGEYRTRECIWGVAPKQIERELEKLTWEYESRYADLDRILDYHVRFERIRPFDDYNGRVGRMLMVKECLRYGVEPFILDDKRRGRYNRGLARWNEAPEELKEVVLEAQQRFRAQMELCKLMQYRRQ